MKATAIVDCSDLYDNAAGKLKRLDNDIDRTTQDLAKEVEARGVPKNKVARQVVRELTIREVLSPSRIYVGLGIEYKRKSRKSIIEKTFPQAENIPIEESTTPRAVVLAASRSGQLETYLDEPDTKLEPEGQTNTRSPRQSFKDKDMIENSELRKQVAQLREQNARLELRIQKLLAENEEQISRLRKDIAVLEKENLPELLKDLHEMFYDKPGLMDAKQLQKISEKAGRDLETIIKYYNTIIKSAVESGEPVPLGTYVIIKPDMKLVPVRIFVDFDKRDIEILLWKKKLQGTASLT